MLYTNKNIVKLKYDNIEEMILFTTPIENNIKKSNRLWKFYYNKYK
jgi:hypothetical protein